MKRVFVLASPAVLYLALAIGRTQDLVHHMRSAADAGELAGIPVVVDGPMGLDATGVYERFQESTTPKPRRWSSRAGSCWASTGSTARARGRHPTRRARP